MRLGSLGLFVAAVALAPAGARSDPTPSKRPPRAFKVVHVFVALCDDEHQGIVKVGKVLGNGRDPEHNLYWGAGYGVKTFFARSKDWVELKTKTPSEPVLRRASFVSKDGGVHVVADAYDGARMDATLRDFLSSAAGKNVTKVTVEGESGAVVLDAGGFSDLVAFVGHNGLMDLALPKLPKHVEGTDQPEAAIVLACLSHKWFQKPLAAASCPPLLATTNFMAPEAYTLDAAIRSWAFGDAPSVTRIKAGKAYAKYQKIAEGSGVGLFATGWAK